MHGPNYRPNTRSGRATPTPKEVASRTSTRTHQLRKYVSAATENYVSVLRQARP
jgi:hypothetical protein